MTKPPVSQAVSRFVAYFGELGPRWGLPKIACEVHALLYLSPAPVKGADIVKGLGITKAETDKAIEFLKGYGLAFGDSAHGWQTKGDPWDMLMTGLEKRRGRELPEALDTLDVCLREASADPSVDRAVSVQIRKMYEMVEGIAAIDATAQKLSPRMLKRLVGIGSIAARVIGGSPRKR